MWRRPGTGRRAGTWPMRRWSTMLSQVEPGVCCPMTMSYAAVPALGVTPAVAGAWVPKILSGRYDAESRPAGEKAGVTVGMAMTEKQGGSDVRANATRAEPDGDGVAAGGAQVVLLGADVGRVPDAGAGAGGAELLSGAALDAGGGAERAASDAAEGQARQPGECVGGDRVSRGLRVDGRGGRRRGADDHRDGAPYPARHRDGAGGADAGGAERGALVVRRAAGVPAAADRAAADGVGAGGPGAGGRERAGARDAGRGGVRCGRPGVCADRGGAGQVSQQQALSGGGLRGDGMPRGGGLRRGGTDADALSRGAAEFDLGGFRQRDLSRHPADAGAGRGGAGAAGGGARRGARGSTGL